MFAKTCPWCDKRIGWTANLGRRPLPGPLKSYELSRTVAVCPFCNNPVKLSKKGQVWVLLAFPMLRYPASAAVFKWDFEVWDPIFVALIVLGLAGGIATGLLSKLEKVHAD